LYLCCCIILIGLLIQYCTTKVHRVVIFAIAQLSCFRILQLLQRCFVLNTFVIPPPTRSVSGGILFCNRSCFLFFWPTVLSVVPLARCVVCRLSVCDVLYCGETVRPSEKVSEGVNRKPGSKVHFLGRRHISTSGFAATATETAVLPYFYPYSPAIGTRWYKWTF